MADWRAFVAGTAALVAAMPASAACQLGRYLELPVLLTNDRALATASIDGKEARFILDSGAFYSTMSHAAAIQYGLKLEALPSWFRLRGLNGDASLAIGKAANFGLGGLTLPKIEFLVGGTATGYAGLLGQNLLGFRDVEYDLPHGAVRLLGATDCPFGAVAYWAGSRPVTVVTLQPRKAPFDTHTIGTVTIDGVRMRAVFDTGAPISILKLAAARRLGVRPDSPGVTPAGSTGGLGSRAVPVWLATFRTIDIGGEAIPRPQFHIADVAMEDADLLIGIEFFRTHRIYVANKDAKMFVTYEGGSVFGLKPSSARSADGKALDLTDKSPEPTDADGYSRRGAVLAAQGKLEPALADLDKAVALAPRNARYLQLRAHTRLAAGRTAAAMRDVEDALAIDPDDGEVHLLRARLRLQAGDRAAAHDDLLAADRSLPPSSDLRLHTASMFDAVDDQEASFRNDDLWLKYHPEDAQRPAGLNGRCWARALLGRELDRALEDCNAAIRARPDNAAFLDSRGLVRLRRGELAQALADYDAALKINPREAWTLYARGLVRRRRGDAAGADADRRAALALEPDIAAQARKRKLEE